LQEIEAAPEDCLARRIVERWYRDKTCACCGRALGEVGRWQHRPCVMSADRRMLEWKDIAAENIPGVLTTHAPVCWTCLVAETHIS
jgi:hypothetical protein